MLSSARVFFRSTWDELKAICLFHVIGFVLEVFKTSGAIQSWASPDFAYSKVLGVPLFSGFMYAAVVLIGFFIWLAENISKFFGVWRYPNQIGAGAVQ